MYGVPACYSDGPRLGGLTRPACRPRPRPMLWAALGTLGRLCISSLNRVASRRCGTECSCYASQPSPMAWPGMAWPAITGLPTLYTSGGTRHYRRRAVVPHSRQCRRPSRCRGSRGSVVPLHPFGRALTCRRRSAGNVWTAVGTASCFDRPLPRNPAHRKTCPPATRGALCSLDGRVAHVW